MKIEEVIVSSGLTFNNPFESFSNFRPSVTLKASMSPDGENVESATRKLQEKADNMVREHKKKLLEQTKNEYENEQKIVRLKRELQESQDQMPF